MKFTPILAVLTCTAAPTIWAETPPESTVQTLETIQIAKPKPDKKTNETTTLQGKSLNAQRDASLAEAMRDQLGVANSGVDVGASRPVVRGQSDQRVQILENGRPLEDVSALSPDHAVASLLWHKQRVEVLEGASVLLYSPIASGGAVNIKDGLLPDLTLDSAQQEFMLIGSDQNKRGLAFTAQAGKAAQYGWQFEASAQEADDYQAVVGNNDQDILNSNETRNHLGLGGNVALLDGKASLGGSARLDTHKYGIADGVEGQNLPGETGVRIDLRHARFDGKLNYGKHQFSAQYQDYQHQEIEDTGEVATQFNKKTTGARWQLPINFQNKAELIVGAEIQRENLDISGEEAFLPNSETTQSSAFAAWKRPLGAHELSASARLQQQNIEFNNTKNRKNTVSAVVANRWQFSPNWAISAQLSHNERAPSIEELGANGVHLATQSFDEGDANIGKEQNQQFDLNFTWNNKNQNFLLKSFYQHAPRFIVRQNLDENGDNMADFVDEDRNLGGDFQLLRYANVKARWYGAESSYEHRHRFGTHQLEWRVWGDVVVGKLVDGGHLPRVTPARLGARLRWQPSANWSYQVSGTQYFTQNRVATLETRTDGYLRFDAEARYAWNWDGMRGEIDFSVLNLSNEAGVNHTSFFKDRAPIQSRTAKLGVRFYF